MRYLCHLFALYLTGLLVSDTLSESRHANRRSSITPDFSSPRNSWGDIWWLLLRLPCKKGQREDETDDWWCNTKTLKRNNNSYYSKIGLDHGVTTITWVKTALTYNRTIDTIAHLNLNSTVILQTEDNAVIYKLLNVWEQVSRPHLLVSLAL